MPPRINIVGETYGELTVIEMLYNYNNSRHTYCKCINNDNIEVIVRADALKNGSTKTVQGSKNKGRKKDLIGMRFGRLVVTSEAIGRAKNGGILYNCDCDCGNSCIASSGNLMRGRALSCGCLTQEYYDSLSKDITGMRFGSLVAIKPIGRKGAPGNYKRLWLCLCDCGNYIKVTLSDLVSGNTQSCGCNKTSRGERFIADLLVKNNICFSQQKTFDDCKNRKKLKFDFYLMNYNTVIEYDEQQHFEPVDFFGGEDGFIIQQKRDKIKDKYCKEHNIHLVRIPYYYTKCEIEETVLSILSPATITA